MKKLSILLLVLFVAVLLPCVTVQAAENEPVTVYLDAANGADTNTGLTEAQAVKTIAKAYGVLADQITDSATTGKIVLVTDYTHTMTAENQTIVSTDHAFEVIITGKTAATVLTVHYSGTAYLGLRGPTTFENITMNVSGSSNMTIYGNNGGKLTIGQNVKTTSTTKFKLSAGPLKAYTGNMSLEVNSGNWQDLCAGAYMYTMNGNGSLVMNGGSVVNLEVTYNGKQTGDVTITVNGGTITNLYGGSRNNKGVLTGNLTLNLNGGTVTKLLDADGLGTISGTKLLNLGGGELTIGTGIRVNVTGSATGTTTVTVNGTPTFGTAYVTGNGKEGSVVYTNGTCTYADGSFTLNEAVSKNIALKYDDRKDLTALLGQAPVDVTVSNEQVISYKVGTQEKDEHVVIYEKGKLIVTGIGTADLTVNGTTHQVTITPATISMFMITGHSVGAGDGGNIAQSVVCEPGQVYSSHRPYSITSGEGGLGYGADVRAGCKNSDGTDADISSQQHLDAFTAAGIGTLGEGSALGYRWNQLTGDKVWVLNFAVGGSCLNEWQTGVEGHATWTKYHYDTAVRSFGYAQTVVKNEIAAGHYSFGHMVAFYHNGVNYSNYPGWTYEKIEQDYLRMWNGYKNALATDMDGDGDTETIEGLGLLPFYNFVNEYTDHFDKPAAYYMASSARYPDIFLASNIYFGWMKEEGLSTFPDITYTVQNGKTPAKPVSIAHSNNGGTSSNSVFCKADNMHPTQVVHNAVGMDIAESLYNYLNNAHTTTSVTLQDQAHNAVTSLNMVVGEKKILVPMITPKVKGNVTYTVDGVLELSYPLQITATAAGTGTVTAQVNGQVLAQVVVTVTENTHNHCVCGGHYDHECTSESWIAWGDDAYEQTLLPFLSGNYYLVSDININRSMLVEEGEDIRLCLNGFVVNTGSQRVVNNQGSLVITDCSIREKWGTLTSSYSGSYSQVFYNYPTGVLNIYSGNLVAKGSSSWGSVGLIQGGIVNIFNGDLQGAQTVVKNNLDLRGGTLYLMGGQLNIYGGSIHGGKATSGGNIYAEKGTLRISGGTITGGEATLGGNIYASHSTTIELSGGVIENGVSKNEGGNIYLYTSSTTENGATVSRHSALNISGGTIQNGTATRGNQIFATTGGNLSSGNWVITISGGNITGKATDNSAVVLRNNAHATISGGTISGGLSAIRLERSATSGAVSKLTLTGDASLAGTDTEIFVDKSKSYGQLHISNLNTETPLRIDATDVGEIAATGSDCSAQLVSVREGYAVGYTDGKLTLVPGVAQTGSRCFATLQQAFDHAQNGYVKLLSDVTGDVTVSGSVYFDLNGKTLTGDITGNGELYGMDSATDMYTADTMGRITGTVSCKVQTQFKTDVTGQVRRYMAIADDNGYTFHRFYLGITHMSLKPGANGVGYKAVFYGDEMVLSRVTGYGYTLWVGENGEKLSAGKEEAFVSGKTVTLRLQNFDVENYGEEKIYGQVYLKLADGTSVESSNYSYTLRGLVESIAEDLSGYNADQLQALRDMLLRFESTVSGWDIDSLF